MEERMYLTYSGADSRTGAPIRPPTRFSRPRRRRRRHLQKPA